MNMVKVKVFPWQEPRDFLGGDLDFKIGDLAVVEIDSICEVGFNLVLMVLGPPLLLLPRVRLIFAS